MYSTTSQCLCHSESCANHATKLAIVLAASYSLSYSPSLTRSHTHRVLLALILAAPYSTIVPTAGVIIAILLIVVVLIASCCICQLSFVSYTQSNATRVKTAFLHVTIAVMDVMLGACAGDVKCGSSIYRCTLDIENRTGLSHYAWNPLRVYECDASICCDNPCLDRQCNHGAMTCIVRMLFALTWLHPEGKCPDTVRPEGKCPATLRPVSKYRGILRSDARCRGDLPLS